MASFHFHTTGHGGRSIAHIFTAPLASAGYALANVRRWGTLLFSTVTLSGAFLLGGLVAGVIISTEWQAQPTSSVSAAAPPVTRQSDKDIVAATISHLESEQIRLKKQIADLRIQLNASQTADARRKNTLTDTNNELTRQRNVSGMAALHGAGIIATLDDSTARSIPEDEDPANYILHDYDLRDVLNALWIAGAEAISINGERIVSSTSLYCVGTTVICNATRLSPPFEVRAIGDAQALSAALKGSSQMAKLNQRAEIYNLPITVEQNQDVLVPAYNGSFVFKYATTVQVQ